MAMGSVPFAGVQRTSSALACTAGKSTAARGLEPSSTTLIVGVLPSSETAFENVASEAAEGTVLLAFVTPASSVGAASVTRKKSREPFAVLSVSSEMRETDCKAP
jgi:hypothetical protein